MTPRLRDVLAHLTSLLTQAGIETAARDARAIVGAVLRIPTDRLTLMLDEPVDQTSRVRAEVLANRRQAREPLSHLTGSRLFYNHSFSVSPAVLDPRPETECLVRAALERPFRHLLDLGTGSGCILLSLLAARPGSSGIGTDLSPEALEVAATNAAMLGIEPRAMFLQSDWFAEVEGRFDLIVSNPPYIAAKEMDALEPELEYEPRLALTDGEDGLSAYRAIIPQARGFLLSQGRLMVEVGWQQGPCVARMFEDAGYRRVHIRSDLDGRDRIVEASLD
ncbi:MAG: peptide chain release factor N(5)-glutamine methyltransferase [Pseudomonadota bacterium]